MVKGGKELKDCPMCESEGTLKKVYGNITVSVRGLEIEVKSVQLVCSHCDSVFESPEKDPLEEAYRKYREKNNWMQPEDIKKLRERYRLSQHEFADILGFGKATLSRYENGALQDNSSETLLEMAKDPSNLIRHLTVNKAIKIEDKKKEELLCTLRELEDEMKPWKSEFQDRFGSYEPDIFSGYSRLNLDKLFNAVMFFCDSVEGIFKTKLNKLLFFSDFLHYKIHGCSITGSRYAKLQFGPVPDNYDFYFAALIKEGKLSVNEINYPDIIGEKYVSKNEADRNVFTDDELETLLAVKKKFSSLSAKQISEFSHDEPAYKETRNIGGMISYDFAKLLQAI